MEVQDRAVGPGRLKKKKKGWPEEIKKMSRHKSEQASEGLATKDLEFGLLSQRSTLKSLTMS